MIQQVDISMIDFARAMRQRCPAFNERVTGFESRFGPADDDTLALLAQAAYFCWYECEYEQDFLEVCRAIGLGQPTSQYLCCQVTPARWDAINAYVIALQRWRGSEQPLGGTVNPARVQQMAAWLGATNASKQLLADLFLHWLIRDVRMLSLSRLTTISPSPCIAAYNDYSNWYRRSGGSLYGRDLPSALAEIRQRLLDLGQMPAADIEPLLKGITAKSQPACQHRYTRYQDIKLASIGALKWRGHVPPDDDAPRQQAAQFLDAATAAVRAWTEGRPPESPLSVRIQQALGPLSDRKRAMALDFFLAPKDGINNSFFTWLCEQTAQLGCQADHTSPGG